MIYGDSRVKWNERNADPNDPLGLNTYTYRPDIYAIMQSGNLYVYGVNNPRVNTTTDRRIPERGEPNSITRQVDSNGRTVVERHYGPDGRAVQDVHFTAHGNTKTHPTVPHRHIWDWLNPTNPFGPGLPMP